MADVRLDAATIAGNAIGLFIEGLERRGHARLFEDTSWDFIDAEAAANEAVAEVVAGVEADVPEPRPFVIGEGVYVRGAPGVIAPSVRVVRDRGDELGEDVVETTQGLVRARFLRRDRRGQRLPVYAERPLTDTEKAKLREEGPWV